MTNTSMEDIKRERRACTGYLPPEEYETFQETCRRVHTPVYEALRQAAAMWVGYIEHAEALALEEAADRVIAAREAAAGVA